MGSMSRRKGAAGEREWAHFLKMYGLEARRGQQFSGSPDSPDVVCEDLPLHWEVKRTEALSPYKALTQAKDDCGSNPKKFPAVAHRRSRRNWIVILEATAFMKLLGHEVSLETSEPLD